MDSMNNQRDAKTNEEILKEELEIMNERILQMQLLSQNTENVDKK